MGKHKAAIGMFVVLLLSYIVNAMDRQLFSVLATDVRNALGLSVPQVGLAATVFTLGMGVAFREVKSVFQTYVSRHLKRAHGHDREDDED